MQQKSWWQEVISATELSRDERTKFVHQLAMRNVYFTLTLGLLWVGTYDFATTGRGDLLWFGLTLAIVSSIFLIFKWLWLGGPIRLDERAQSAIAHSFVWAALLALITYVAIFASIVLNGFHAGRSSGYQTWFLPFFLAMLVQTATHIVTNTHPGGYYFSFWSMLAITLCGSFFGMLIDLGKGFIIFLFSPYTAFTVSATLLATLVIRNIRKRPEAPNG
ncbi:MAG: hypothetical protein ABIO92_04640 [Chloroflexia bacterium]